MESLYLKETYLRSRIGREDTFSRRYSKSFRSNIIISSIASSPGYALNEEIDPSTYSFTKALQALQARDDMSLAEGVALHSKWREAERYICNPVSGEVPAECLSARTLSGRSFSQLTRRITVSASLVHPLQPGQIQIKHSLKTTPQHQVRLPIQLETKTENTKRGVIQSPSPTSTPSIEERSIRRNEKDSEEESPFSTKINVTFQEEEKRKETSEEVESIRKHEQEKNKVGNNKRHIMCRWNLLIKRNQQDCKHRSRKTMFFFCHNICC